MITSLRFFNPQTEKLYLLEYGKDLFGNYFVKVRYGPKLGIAKNYLFDIDLEQTTKVQSIISKREQQGYVVVS